MNKKDISLLIVEIMHFIALVGCWFVIWVVAGVLLFSKRGIILFVAILIISLLSTFKNVAQDIIKDKYFVRVTDAK
jgi:hypothetical protein